MLFLLIAAGVLLLLLLPVRLRVRARTEKESIRVQLEWLLGKWYVVLFEKKITAAVLFKKKKSKVSAKAILQAIRRHTSLKKLAVKSSIGTGSAASTAIVCGKAFGLLAPAVISAPGGVLDIEPVFDKATFEAAGEYTASVNLLHTLLALLEIKRSGKNGKSS